MRGLLIPDAGEDFTADPVELFYDLAFVFAFSQLVGYLIHHPTWQGGAEAALLFGILWLPWSWFTWSANAVPGNQRSVRAVFLVATAITIPMAASTGAAFGDGGLVFALSGAAIMLMSIALQVLALDRESATFQAAISLAAPVLVALALLVAGGLVDGAARVWLWIAMVVIIFLATAAAGNGEWIVRAGHFAERHGLILIIALGEVVVAIGIAVSGEVGEGGLSNELWLAMISAGALAGLLWWAYFDRVVPALEHKCEETDASDRGRYARNVYTWAHAPIIAGIITAAAATEEILLHPSDELYQEFRIMFVIGLALFFGGIALAVYLAYRVLAYERLIGLAVITLLMIVGGSIAGMWLLLAAVAIIAVTLVAPHQRIEC